MTNLITFFALAYDGCRVVSFEVESTTRGAVDVALASVAGHTGLCWYVDMIAPATPAWAASAPSAEGRVESDKVPASVREAGALWWAAWAGRDCAREWHEEEPHAIEAGTEYADWAGRQGGLPAEGDLEFLADGIGALTGADWPTDEQQEAFRKALLERLWDLSPVEEAA